MISRRNALMIVATGFLIFETLLIAFVDRPLSEFLRSVDAKDPGYIDIFRAYTDIGKAKWWLITSGIGVALSVLFLRMSVLTEKAKAKTALYGKALLFFFVCLAGTGLIADIIKPIIGRARPVILERENFYGIHPLTFHATYNGMPSGHTVTAFAIAACLTLFFPRKQVWWLLLAAMIGVSRIMVNAHFLSDVFAGAALGYTAVFVFYRQINHNVINHIQNVIFPIDTKK